MDEERWKKWQRRSVVNKRKKEDRINKREGEWVGKGMNERKVERERRKGERERRKNEKGKKGEKKEKKRKREKKRYE